MTIKKKSVETKASKDVSAMISKTDKTLVWVTQEKRGTRNQDYALGEASTVLGVC